MNSTACTVIPNTPDIVRELKDELYRLQEKVKDERYVKDVDE